MLQGLRTPALRYMLRALFDLSTRSGDLK